MRVTFNLPIQKSPVKPGLKFKAFYVTYTRTVK